MTSIRKLKKDLKKQARKSKFFYDPKKHKVLWEVTGKLKCRIIYHPPRDNYQRLSFCIHKLGGLGIYYDNFKIKDHYKDYSLTIQYYKAINDEDNIFSGDFRKFMQTFIYK